MTDPQGVVPDIEEPACRRRTRNTGKPTSCWPTAASCTCGRPGPADADEIRAMHGRMSARTLYLRYFSAVTQVSDQQVALFTGVDHVNSAGLVAVLGGQIIAAGTYHRNPTGDTDSAEVAFMVEDAQQRRGLGSILLEHLAAAAQERGIRRFTAEVLSENTQMVRVFIDAGYSVSREYDSGVVDLVFDIEPTEKSRAVVIVPGAPRRGPVDRPAAVTAVDRRDRRVRRRRPSSAMPCW